MGMSLGLDFSAQIGELNSRLGRMEAYAAKNVELTQAMRGHPARQSTALQPVASIAAVNAGTAAGPVNIGDPPGGMVWQVQRVTFGMPVAVDASAITTAGTIIIYSGGIEVARNTILPNFLLAKDYQIFVTPNENLTCLWVGGVVTGNTGIIVDTMALEYPLAYDTEIDV